MLILIHFILCITKQVKYSNLITRILYIHRSVYGPTYLQISIKSISLSSKGIKYNWGEKKIHGVKLDIKLFEAFIKFNLNIKNTIEMLRI
jgi:hypothetical protein